MNQTDAADTLRALASRVRRNMPSSGDPERFHAELSEIARSLVNVAEAIAPSTVARRREEAMPRPADKTHILGRDVISHTIVAGRRIIVQHRKAFAVHV